MKLTVLFTVLLIGLQITQSAEASTRFSTRPNLAVLYESVLAQLRQNGNVIYVVPTESRALLDGIDPTQLPAQWWKDCALAPVLTERGKAQATELGDAIRKINITVDGVRSSEVCTTFGVISAMARDPSLPFHPTADLNPAEFQVRQFGYSDAQIRTQILAAVKAVAFADSNAIVVSHPQPLSAAPHPAMYDLQPGDTLVLRWDGGLKLVAKLTIAQWAEMAQYSRRVDKQTRKMGGR